MPKPPDDRDASAEPLRLGVLVSGGGTTLDNLAQRIAAGQLRAEVASVVVSRADAGAVDVAARHGLPCEVIPRKSFDGVASFSDAVFTAQREAGVELVCLAGFLSLLAIPDDFDKRVLNIHPSLLPSFGGHGMYGRRVHEAVLAAGVKLSGCTVHFADNTYDTGPILHQRTCPVLPDDTPATLAARVFGQECAAYPEAIAAVAAGRVRWRGDTAWIDEA